MYSVRHRLHGMRVNFVHCLVLALAVLSAWRPCRLGANREHHFVMLCSMRTYDRSISAVQPHFQRNLLSFIRLHCMCTPRALSAACVYCLCINCLLALTGLVLPVHELNDVLQVASRQRSSCCSATALLAVLPRQPPRTGPSTWLSACSGCWPSWQVGKFLASFPVVPCWFPALPLLCQPDNVLLVPEARSQWGEEPIKYTSTCVQVHVCRATGAGASLGAGWGKEQSA